MKKYFYIAIALTLGLCSCSTDDDNTSEKPAKTVFTATLEGGLSTRTSVDPQKGGVTWSGNNEDLEEIYINGVLYSSENSGATAIFTTEDNEPKKVDGKYNAYYPAFCFQTGEEGQETFSATGNIDQYQGEDYLPMYAESTTNTLEFKNLFSLLAINVKPITLLYADEHSEGKEVPTGTSWSVTIKKIEVSANNGETPITLYGDFEVKKDGSNNPFAEFTNDTDNGTTLVCEAEEGNIHEFTSSGSLSAIDCFPLPITTYSSITVKIYGHVSITDQGEKNVDVDRTVQVNIPFKSSGTIKRSTIYSIALDKDLGEKPQP